MQLPCEVVFDEQMSTFRATTRHKKENEVFMNYGSHPNNYLFIEYNFFLDRNRNDAIYLDNVIFQELTSDDKETLRSHGCYGYLPFPRNKIFELTYSATKYVLDPSLWGPAPKEATILICKWIKAYLEESILAIKRLEGEADIGESIYSSSLDLNNQKIATLLQRWIQIKGLCKNTLDTLV
ncbi:unnamed protein product [Penicillium salamii]|nr:unnamed protein product [Penicillium salamii]